MHCTCMILISPSVFLVSVYLCCYDANKSGSESESTSVCLFVYTCYQKWWIKMDILTRSVCFFVVYANCVFPGKMSLEERKTSKANYEGRIVRGNNSNGNVCLPNWEPYTGDTLHRILWLLNVQRFYNLSNTMHCTVRKINKLIANCFSLRRRSSVPACNEYLSY